jgi:hypothetical protein
MWHSHPHTPSETLLKRVIRQMPFLYFVRYIYPRNTVCLHIYIRASPWRGHVLTRYSLSRCCQPASPANTHTHTHTNTHTQVHIHTGAGKHTHVAFTHTHTHVAFTHTHTHVAFTHTHTHVALTPTHAVCLHIYISEHPPGVGMCSLGTTHNRVTAHLHTHSHTHIVTHTVTHTYIQYTQSHTHTYTYTHVAYTTTHTPSVCILLHINHGPPLTQAGNHTAFIVTLYISCMLCVCACVCVCV